LANLALLLGGAETAFVAPDCNTLGALEMGVVPDLYPGGQPFDDPKIRSRLASLWGGRLSPLPGLGLEAMMAAALEGNLAALWVMGADPASEGGGLGQAVGQVPFLVVQDLYLTDTASLADVVLPAASFAETDGSLTNMTGRWQALRAVKRPPGQARPDWWIIAELAKRLVDDKGQMAWELSGPSDALSEVSRIVPRYRGLSYAAMGEHGWQRPEPGPSVRRTFVRVEADTPILDADYPLALVIGRHLYDRGVLLRPAERLQRLVPGAYVMLHPDDAERAGLVDGDKVVLVSPQGQVGLVLRISEVVVPGVAFAPADLGDVPLGVLLAEPGRSTWVRVEK
jgi:predicted molibdopterin-dependent oxidoreductase YjgC